MAVSGNLGRKIRVVDDVLSSHEQESYPPTSLDKNCLEYEFQRDWNYNVDMRQTYLALKLNFVKGRSYKTYFTQEYKKHREEAEAGEEATAEEKKLAPVPLVNHVKIFLRSFFLILKCTSARLQL